MTAEKEARLVELSAKVDLNPAEEAEKVALLKEKELEPKA